MGSLDKGLDLLEFLADRGDARLADMAVELESSRATAFRLLTALKARGYVQHDRTAKAYRLGPAVRSLAARSDIPSIVRLVGPAMAELRASTGETVNLALVRGGRIVYAAIFDGIHSLRVSPTVGEEVPPHATALGKAILAALPTEELDGFLGPEPYESFSPRTITRRRDLGRELEKVRRLGYAVDDEEAGIQSACVGAAIMGGDGFPVAAVSVSGLAARLKEEARPAVGKAVSGWCEQISRRLVLTQVKEGSSA